jgi:uroporphyrinogen decarboxylase
MRQPVDRRPIWVMRQAGRYLPEYLELRNRTPDFMSFCKSPEMACEATLQPLRRFDLDAAIIFSDILTIPEAMGMDLQFVKGEGPKFTSPLRDEKAFQKLKEVDVYEDLGYVSDAIKLTTRELDNKVPLIGFSGSPWTLATYMIEGEGSKTFFHPRSMIYNAPDLLHGLLRNLTNIISRYLNMQVEAGARVLMVFDSWGGLLSPDAFRQFSLQYYKEIARSVYREYNGEKIPLIFFSKDSPEMLDELADSGCNALGIDWKIEMNEARMEVGDRVALQGNLDPAVMLSTPNSVIEEAKKVIDSYGRGVGHVFNLGHGIDRHTPPENMQVLVDTVHSYQGSE